MERIKFKKAVIYILLFTVMYFLGGGIAMLVHAYGKDKVNESNWGLGFSTEGQPPTGNATATELKKYDAYYIGDTDKKVIYLTFDAG